MKHPMWLKCAVVLSTSALPAAAQTPAPPAAPRAHTMVHVHKGSGFLGVGVEEIDHERAQALGLREEHGVEIKSVEENSPAAHAGLRVGDVVLDYNGQRVEGVEQFTRMVGETPEGRRCTLGIWRNHNGQTLTATLGTRNWNSMEEDESAWRVMPNMPNMPNMPPMPNMPNMPAMPMVPKPTMGWQMGVLGIEGEELNSQLAEFFGVREGVLVRAVVRDSPAEHAGLRAGDVITRIDGTAVTSPREISSLMRGSRNKAQNAVTVVRSRKEMTMEVRKGERSERSEREAPRAPEPPR